MKKKILTVIGTRPEIIKMFPIINRLDNFYDNKLVWSGQHYDYNMVKKIFADVDLRKPDYFIKLSKKIPFFEIQEKLYKIISIENPKAIIYHGDTFTTLAAALISRFFYNNITNIHIEGGYRSFDKTQTEEQIRFIVDHISKLNFVSRSTEKKNLLKENKKKNNFIVGNSVNDSVKKIVTKIKSNTQLLEKYKLVDQKFIYCTIHRSENVENNIRLKKILNIINYISKEYKIIFSTHPRTLKKLQKLEKKFNPNVVFVKPLNYSESIGLLVKCLFCFSDSGGIQEEAIILKKKCVIPSNYTPHNCYLAKNANVILRLDNKNYKFMFKKIMSNIKNNTDVKKFKHRQNVSISIVRQLMKYL